MTSRHAPFKWLRLSFVLKYAIIAFSFFSILHYNLLVQYFPGWQPESPGYQALAELGNKLGLGGGWRMYSPVPKVIHRVEWYGRNADGAWVLLDVPNLSPEHRSRRSFLSAWLWDFKLARVWDNHFVYYEQYDRRLRKVYVDYHRRALEERLGWKPFHIGIVVKVAEIPEPHAKGSWTPYKTEFLKASYPDVIE